MAGSRPAAAAVRAGGRRPLRQDQVRGEADAAAAVQAGGRHPIRRQVQVGRRPPRRQVQVRGGRRPIHRQVQAQGGRPLRQVPVRGGRRPLRQGHVRARRLVPGRKVNVRLAIKISSQDQDKVMQVI